MFRYFNSILKLLLILNSNVTGSYPVFTFTCANFSCCSLAKFSGTTEVMKTCILTKALHAHAAHTKLPLYGNFGILFFDRNNMSPRLIYQKCCCLLHPAWWWYEHIFPADFILENWYLDCAAQFSYAVMIINVMLIELFFNVVFSLLSG